MSSNGETPTDVVAPPNPNNEPEPPRRYQLYVSNDRTDDRDLCPGSKRALSLLRDDGTASSVGTAAASLLVQVRHVASLHRIPEFLTGTPTLLDTWRSECYRGTDAIQVLSTLGPESRTSSSPSPDLQGRSDLVNQDQSTTKKTKKPGLVSTAPPSAPTFDPPLEDVGEDEPKVTALEVERELRSRGQS